MRTTASKLAVLSFLLALCAPGAALADRYEYSTMLPEQIEKEIRSERKAYRATMDELHSLENGPMDKNSAQYKAAHEELLKRAVDQKVRLDEMGEALASQGQAYGGGN